MSKNVNILDWTPYAYENLIVTTLAVSRPTEVYRLNAGALFLTVEDNSINFRMDGGDPTANLGHLLSIDALQNLWLSSSASIRNLRLIASGGNALVKITYYRRQ